MSRHARVVIPGIPHHVTQRGNRRQPVFFKEVDRLIYLRILKQESERYGVAIWAYCLMENHVHLIAVPEKQFSLARMMSALHWRYTRWINHREGWKGFLWQGRFSSFPMDESYLLAAVRYVERNPVQAGIVEKADDYRWSSARAHVRGDKDPLIRSCFLSERIKDWAEYLAAAEEASRTQKLEEHIKDGLPLGTEEFIHRLEQQTGKSLMKKKPGRKPTIHSVTVTE